MRPLSTKLPQKDEIYRSFITSTYMNFCWGKIYLTDFIGANKVKFPEGIKVGEDVKFQLSLLKYHPKMCYIDKDLVKYRQLSTSVMYVFTLSRFDDMAEDLNTRKQLMNKIEWKTHERKAMYEDVGRNTLSYIKQASKFTQEEQRIELIQKIEDQAVQEVLENIPVKQLPITMRDVVFLLRRKRYSVLLKIKCELWFNFAMLCVAKIFKEAWTSAGAFKRLSSESETDFAKNEKCTLFQIFLSEAGSNGSDAEVYSF